MPAERGGRVIEDAVQAFWKAAALLAEPERRRPAVNPAAGATLVDKPERRRPAVDPSICAAEALLTLASNDAEMALRTILRPDPDVVLALDEVTWTVSYFEAGNIDPAGLHEFDTACAAIDTLTRCSDMTHATSELICSAGTGLQWVAAVRSDLGLIFQFPDLGNLSAADPRTATSAITRWRDHAHSMNRSLPEPPVPERSNVIDLVPLDGSHKDRGKTAPMHPANRTTVATGLDRAVGHTNSLLKRVATLAADAATRNGRGRAVQAPHEITGSTVEELREHYERRLGEQARQIERMAAEIAEQRTRLEDLTKDRSGPVRMNGLPSVAAAGPHRRHQTDG